ncbi:MAG: hypothetical protein IAE91_05855 [Ignavibacteriaceae bacterium]|nr:hypothetical protein [Ignavibacteriaceae bacterium]
MRYPIEMVGLKGNIKYAQATKLLNLILNRQEPDLVILGSLYGNERANIIHSDICEFIEKFLIPFNTKRQHQYSAPEIISKSRLAVEMDPAFQKLHSEILLWKIPETKLFEPFYGEYSEFAAQTVSLFLENKLVRKCGIPSAAHLNRVGVLPSTLGFNKEGHFRYSGIAIGHDFIEDLLFKLKDENNKLYGFTRYHEFLEKFIPKELREGISILTNHYDLLINFAQRSLARKNSFIGLKNIIDELELLSKTDNFPLLKYLEAALNLLKSLEFEQNDPDELRWLCYKKLFISDLAREAKESGDNRIFEIKSLDLSDNGHGIGSLSVDSKIKNLIKQTIWSNEGFQMGVNWQPLNEKIMELHEDCLVYAEYIIVKDLLEQRSSQDFIISGLHKINLLAPVLYTD